MSDVATLSRLAPAVSQLPVDWYFDEKVFALEKKLLFDAGSGYVGHQLMVPETGNYRSLEWKDHGQMLLNGGTYNGVQILRPATVKFLGGHTLSAVQQAGFDNWIGLEGFSYGNLMRVLVDPTRAVTLGSKGEFGWDGWLGCYMEVVPEQNMTFLMMTQKKDAGTYTLSRKIRNIIFSE